MSESSCNCSPPLFVFITAHISASAVLSDQYLSSQAVISDHHQIDLMAITLLFTWCFVLVFFLYLSRCPLFLSLHLTCSFSPIHSVFVSLSSSIIMFHTLVIASLLRARILAGHTAFLLTVATYTITLARGRKCARVQKALSSAALRQEFVSRVCE